MNAIDCRLFGHGERSVIVLHGGPGAPGSSDPIAVALSERFTAYAPRQRGSGDIPLTVRRHIDDLKEVVDSCRADAKPAVVGESWGAMLGLAFAGAYPESLNSLVLIGCGTFTEDARQVLIDTRRRRIEEYLRAHPEHTQDARRPFSEQVLTWHELTDTFRPLDGRMSIAATVSQFDRKGYEQTWNDMVRCQREGVYPNAFVRITCPVLMIHGEYDPHPGRMIRDHLRRFIPHLEYREMSRCGHAPSMEKYARDDFHRHLDDWLAAQLEREQDSAR